MALHENLQSLYHELLPNDLKNQVDLFVVPLIRFNYTKSDYLYLLYKDIIAEEKSRFKIHSTSIWNHWKFVWRALRKPNVILHYHWLECTNLKSLAGIAYKLFCIILFKKLGGKLVWTVHNKMPHDSRFTKLNYKIRSSMANRANLLHVHCKAAIEEVSDFFNQPITKFRVIPHPVYPVKSIPREKAIQKINLKQDLDLKMSNQIFLMFGNISSYKQIEEVAYMFEELPDYKKLVIVGPVKKGQMTYYRNIKELATASNNILLIPHFVPEDDVPLYHCASDCVVFNYRQILTSGGFALAESYDRNIIAPRLGCLSELGGNKVQLFESQEELFTLLSDFSTEEYSDA
ncbi:hypothetical protein BH23BAC3_BH23BAC3_09920 [soil metagenome]